VVKVSLPWRGLFHYVTQNAAENMLNLAHCFTAARTKLRRLQREEEAKKVAAASKFAADRSPHTKEVSYCTDNSSLPLPVEHILPQASSPVLEVMLEI